MSYLIELKGISKLYQMGDAQVPALVNADLYIQQGEMLAIVGASGSGKSTLMNIIGFLDTPTHGEYVLQGKSVANFSDDERATLRNKTVGFIFQQFFLLARLTAQQNVALPLLYRHESPEYIDQKTRAMLEKVGMEKYCNHTPLQLSGGQQQRVAIARALVGEPLIILADEPTGSLDSKTGQEVMALFLQLNREGVTIVIVTHDPVLAQRCPRQVTVVDGKVQG